jgi:hypothetical protein
MRASRICLTLGVAHLAKCLPAHVVSKETLRDVTELDEFARPVMPSQLERQTTERNDMLVVYLVVAFVLWVIVMETGKSLFRRK